MKFSRFIVIPLESLVHSVCEHLISYHLCKLLSRCFLKFFISLFITLDCFSLRQLDQYIIYFLTCQMLFSTFLFIYFSLFRISLRQLVYITIFSCFCQYLLGLFLVFNVIFQLFHFFLHIYTHLNNKKAGKFICRLPCCIICYQLINLSVLSL